MTRDWIVQSPRGMYEIRWMYVDQKTGNTAMSVLQSYVDRGYNFAKISRMSKDIFGLHRSANTLSKAHRHYIQPKKSTPKNRVTHTGVGLTRADYEQMPSGTIIRVNGIEVVLP